MLIAVNEVQNVNNNPTQRDVSGQEVGQHRRNAILIAGGLMSYKYPEWLTYARKLGLGIYSIDAPSEHNQHIMSSVYSSDDERWPDIVSLIDASDTAAFLGRVLTWSSEVNFEAVLVITDQFVFPAALAAKTLKLPNPGIFASYVSRNKVIQRELLASDSPAFQARTPAELKKIIASGANNELPSFPFIIKPSGRSSSSGVFRIQSNEQLNTVVENEYQDDEIVLLEEIIDGQEYSVESVVKGGNIEWYGVTKKHTNEDKAGSFFVEMQHTVPGTLPGSPIETALINLNKRAIACYQVETGTTHLEARITATGRAYIMEMAVRPPGGMIGLLHSLTDGILFEQRSMNAVLGLDLPLSGAKNGVAVQRYFTVPKDGVFTSFESGACDSRNFSWPNAGRFRQSLNLPSEMGLFELSVDHKFGKALPANPSTSSERLGYVIAHEANEDEAVQLSKSLIADLSIGIA